MKYILHTFTRPTSTIIALIFLIATPETNSMALYSWAKEWFHGASRRQKPLETLLEKPYSMRKKPYVGPVRKEETFKARFAKTMFEDTIKVEDREFDLAFLYSRAFHDALGPTTKSKNQQLLEDYRQSVSTLPQDLKTIPHVCPFPSFYENDLETYSPDTKEEGGATKGCLCIQEYLIVAFFESERSVFASNIQNSVSYSEKKALHDDAAMSLRRERYSGRFLHRSENIMHQKIKKAIEEFNT